MTSTGPATEETPTAALLIIGDEILSGRTRDANLPHLAAWLGDLGIALREVRVVPDHIAVIVEAVNTLRHRFSYVFTTGGIGPTHDDVTIDAVAEAFGRPLELHREALKRLQAFHRSRGVDEDAALNDGRRRMVTLPAGCTLVDNPISAAPGFQVDNVFVLAGIPEVMQAMLETIRPRLKAGAPYSSVAITAHVPESVLSGPLGELQNAFPDLTIGSYPFYHESGPGAEVVVRGRRPESVDEAAERLRRTVEVLEREIGRG